MLRTHSLLHPPARKTNQEWVGESAGEDVGWLISLSDLTLLLFCFFVIWHVVDKRSPALLRHEDVTQGGSSAAASVVQAVQPEPSELQEPPPSSADLEIDLTQIPVYAAPPQPTAVLPLPDPLLPPEPVATTVPPSPSSAIADPGAKDTLSPGQLWEELRGEVERYVKETGLDQGVGVVSTQHELLVSLKDTVPFASGSAELRQETLPVLEKVAALVHSHPDLAVEILGHTDDIPITTPEFPSNWELSAARASRVARYLVERGIDPTRVSTQGYASFRPLLPNTSAENRAANRRVEIRLYRRVDRNLSSLPQR
jgi:flagellar motor protein MotB